MKQNAEFTEGDLGDQAAKKKKEKERRNTGKI